MERPIVVLRAIDAGELPPRRRRRWPGVLLGVVLLAVVEFVALGHVHAQEADPARFVPTSRGTLRGWHVDLVAQHFPPEQVSTALDVIWCESAGSAGAVGPYRERGWFQVHPIWQPLADAMFWPGVSLADPEVNVAVAARLYDLFGGWGPWYSSRRCWGGR